MIKVAFKGENSIRQLFIKIKTPRAIEYNIKFRALLTKRYI